MMDLRILKLNYNPPDILELGFGAMFERMDEVTIITSLMQTFEKYILVVEVKWKGSPDLASVERLKLVERAEEISRDGNTSILIVSGKFPEVYREVIRKFFDTFNCFIEFPARFTLGTMTGSIVGTQEDINRFLKFAESWGATYEVISVRKYHPKLEGVLSTLTPKQSTCLGAAVRLGYFDVPRKVSSRELASKLDISHSTMLEHIKKGQRQILSALFNG
ncbi:MAG: helix-turn-helix domain-containing protein [Candidatus Thermoplasmatota archaeon]|nr:helix-turn-helix domain-containing protein [Candidatus Thermoplasmatota archaeon]